MRPWEACFGPELDWEKLWRDQVFGAKMTETNGHKLLERPRNWGSFGAELNGLKPWRRGGFRCFWEAGKLLAGCWWKLFGGSFGAELNGLNPWRRGDFRCFWEAGKLLAGCSWKLFGRLVSGGKC